MIYYSAQLFSYASNVQQSYREQLQTLGLLEQGKGNYFLPVTIKPNLLTECWKEHGEFPVEHEVFFPLQTALDKLLQSTKILDAIFLSEAQIAVSE